MVRTATHRCLAVCFTYDVELRSPLSALSGEEAHRPDGRLPPAVERLGRQLPSLDWSIDYVRGDTVLLEKAVHDAR